MNTKCPQCGTSYNVTEAHIGRKVKCKNCAAAMVVTGNGLELQGGAAPPPPPPVAASAFEFDGGAAVAEEERDDERPAGKRKKDKRRNRDEDDEDDRPRRSKERPAKAPGNLGAYLSFKKMVGPFVLIPVFWLVVALIVLGALVGVIAALMSGSTPVLLGVLAYTVIGVPLYLVMIRISFELAMAVYRTYDIAVELKQLRDQPTPPAAPDGGGP